MGAAAIILNEDCSQVLLHKREDFRIWALPGGGIEPGERPEQAAIRETLEETGYEVRIVRLVGMYSYPQINDTVHLYECVIIGGKAITKGPETLAVAWHPVNQLPRCAPSTGRYVADTIARQPDSLKMTITYPRWAVILRGTALRLRDIRNRFFRQDRS